MRAILVCLLLLFAHGSWTPAGAQESRPGAETGTITGVAVSALTGQPLVAASVSVRRMADSTLVAATLTDHAGRFVREGLPFGSYRVEVASVGHVAMVQTGIRLAAEGRRQDLGTLLVRGAVVEVQGVTAEGQRAQVTVATDRSVYYVREMPVVQGGFATDALRAIPELEVDIDDNVRARGSEPQIFLDGRPLPMQGAARIAFLRSLRADRIERIEFIPSPSARFEAEGQSGIVNIVLRRDVALGLSGSTSANVGTRGTQNLSTRLNYQQGRMTLFGGGLLGFNQTRVSSFDLRQNRAANPITYLQHSLDREREGINGGADATAELRLTPRSTVWTIARVNGGDADELARSEFIHLDDARAATERYERENRADSGNDSYSGALGYRRVIEAQRNELSAELRYNRNASEASHEDWRYRHTFDGIRLDAPADLTRVGTDTEESLWALQLDLSRPLATATRLDVGYRANLRTNATVQQLALLPGGPLPERQEHERFRYDQDSHAVYANLEHRFGRWGLQGGLRVEDVVGRVYATSLESAVRSDRTTYFPSANLAYDFGGGRQLRLAYAKRIERPGAAQLNPIDTSPADPLNRMIGNPNLEPADVHTANVDASWTGAVGTLRLSSFFFQGSDLPDRIRTADASGTSTLKWQNIASARAIGFNLNASVRQVGPVTGFVGLNLGRVGYDAGGVGGIGTGSFLMWGANGNVTATLSPSLRVQTTASYSPGQPSTQGRSSGLRMINVGLTQRVLSDRGTLTLSLVDPFNLSRTTLTTRDAYHEQTGRTSNRMRRASLSFSYSFGRAPQSQRRTVQDESGGGLLGGPQPQ